MGKEKKNYCFDSFFHFFGVKTFLKWIINYYSKGTRYHDPIKSTIHMKGGRTHLLCSRSTK